MTWIGFRRQLNADTRTEEQLLRTVLFRHRVQAAEPIDYLLARTERRHVTIGVLGEYDELLCCHDASDVNCSPPALRKVARRCR